MTKGPAAVFLQQDPLGIILILIFSTLGVTIAKRLRIKASLCYTKVIDFIQL